jgi:hypothetical protein
MTRCPYAALAIVAMFISASAAMTQDARLEADERGYDAATGVQPYATVQPRIIWRTPEIRPLTWEEQREFERSPRSFQGARQE